MRTIHVHGSAESDLIDVWRYSFEQWGELQADKSLTSEQYCRVSLRVLGGQHTGGLLLVAQCIGDEVHDQKME